MLTRKNRKLFSCFTNFSHLKLIIPLLLLFISIKCDDGENVHRFDGHGVSVNVSVGQVSAEPSISDAVNGNDGKDNGTAKSHYNFNVNASQTTDRKERVLSRRRRYLIFPEGSSIQLGMKYV